MLVELDCAHWFPSEQFPSEDSTAATCEQGKFSKLSFNAWLIVHIDSSYQLLQ